MNQVIPEAAVIAASKALMADKMSNHSGDNAPQIMDACERVARKVLEVAAPHMLAQVSTLEDLDALPRFSVIRSDEGAVFERQTMWHEAGSRDLKYSPDIALPATVLQLGWGEE